MPHHLQTRVSTSVLGRHPDLVHLYWDVVKPNNVNIEYVFIKLTSTSQYCSAMVHCVQWLYRTKDRLIEVVHGVQNKARVAKSSQFDWRPNPNST